MDLPSRLSFLFGTEENVDMRRQLVLFREILYNHKGIALSTRYICSGSLGEGVAYPPSDDDVMLCSTAHRVVKSYREATQMLDLLMVTSEYFPGYCLLLDIYRSHNESLVFIVNGMPFLSSSLFKQMNRSDDTFIHGPCVSGAIGPFEYDLARCIPCSFWPHIADDWLVRNRSYGWPSHEMIQDIVRAGCYVVPIGHPDSPFSDHEWRISFSVAERTLMHSLNHAQFLTYNLLRLTLKRIIENRLPGVLCSYFMKTTLFYTLENTSTRLWQVNDLETCLKACLSVLYDYVDRIYCPNYFIPEYNMIKRKVNYTNRHLLLDLIRSLYNIGIVRIIYLSEESLALNEKLELKFDMEFMFSNHLNGTVNTRNMFQYENIEACTFSLCQFVRILKGNMHIKHWFINFILPVGIRYCCQNMMNILWSKPRVTKVIYRYHKTVESLLRLGYNGDVTTGKLTRATYMYMVGKTQSALTVIRQLLSEYPPYVMDGVDDYLKMAAYEDVMCSRGYTIDYKARHALAPTYALFSEYLNAAPLPLRIWISIKDCVPLHPLLYAYFLESLCYVRLQNRLSLIKSIRCLTNYIDDVKNRGVINTRMCVGIIKYVQGDNQSACRWLGSAYITDTKHPPLDEVLSRSVLTYMSCMLNKQFRLENRNP